MAALFVKDINIILPRFLFILLEAAANELLAPLMCGATNVTMSSERLTDVAIPLPPLEIQREIVEEIEGYQRLIDGARAVVDNWRPKIEVDPTWPVVPVGDLFHRSHNVLSPGALKEPASLVGLENITPNTGQLVGDVATSERAQGKNFKNTFRAGDILYGRLRPNLNKVWLADRKGLCSSDLLVIRSVEQNVLPKLFAYLLRSSEFNSVVLQRVTGARLPRISWTQFQRLGIPLPPIETQRAIVAEIEREQAVVNSNHELIELFEKKIEAAIARVWKE